MSHDQQPIEPTHRRPYTKPELEELGGVVELTQGGPGQPAQPDGGQYNS